MIIGFPFIFVLMIFIILLCNDNSSSSPQIMATAEFQCPFEANVNYHITSGFGYRIDPLNRGTLFHDGIDLSVPMGTNILASNSGKVVRAGYQVGGLGNYVCIEHVIKDVKYYSCYGHMLDNSIVVHEGQQVKVGDKLGSVGMSGAATGYHLHFMILTPELEFSKQYAIDPTPLAGWLK